MMAICMLKIKQEFDPLASEDYKCHVRGMDKLIYYAAPLPNLSFSICSEIFAMSSFSLDKIVVALEYTNSKCNKS